MNHTEFGFTQPRKVLLRFAHRSRISSARLYEIARQCESNPSMVVKHLGHRFQLSKGWSIERRAGALCFITERILNP